MAFNIGMLGNGLGLGLNLLGGISGLLGGGSAAKQAQLAQEKAIQELETGYEGQWSSQLGAGMQGQNSLAGKLSDSLGAAGRGLGAGMAGAGVYNSSATAGALSNLAGQNAGALGDYSSNLAQILAQIKGQETSQAAGMRYGMAGDQLNYARQQQAQGIGGLSSFLGQLGQTNLFGSGARGVAPNTGEKSVGTVLTPGAPLSYTTKYDLSPALGAANPLKYKKLG